MQLRNTESITLHFDLNHCPLAKEFTLTVLGKRYLLTPHTAETLAAHAEQNRALAILTPESRQKISHFATEVQMPSDAVGIHLVSCPSHDPTSLLSDLVLAFVYVPHRAKRKHFRKKQKHGRALPIPPHLYALGVESISPEDHPGVALDATKIITPFQAAEAIIFHHPELMSVRADVAANVLYNHIYQTLKADSTLPLYISANGPGTANPYTYNTVATDPTGKVIVPIDQDEAGNPIVDKEGTPLKWPQQNGQNVAPQNKLSEGVVGNADGSQPGAAASALFAVLRSTKDDPSLNGQAWSIQHGLTSRGRTGIEPQDPPVELTNRPVAALVSAALDDAPTYKWKLSNLTSQYGIDIDFDSLSFDASSATLSLRVQNWANRSLSVYAQFYDETGATTDSDPTYLQILTAGNQIAGIPVWTGYVTISATLPDTAVKADIMLGGIGIGNVNGDVDKEGVTSTAVFNYAIPTLLIGLSVGTTGARLYYKSLEDTMVTIILVVVQSFLGAPALLIAALSDPLKLIGIFGNIAVGVIFSQGLAKIAQAVTGYATTTEVLEKVPILGWIFQILSCAAGIGGMIATTAEVCKSPATYTLEAARVIDLQVTITPDPTHGTASQDPIWPLESDHWEIAVQYQGGTAVKQTGSIASIKPDKDLSVLFTDDTAISAAPGAQIQITANLYSANDWLCGQWTSQWIAAVGDNGTTKLSVSGSIIEFLVPLSSTTQYEHYQKLVYQNGHHAWQLTPTQPTEVWSGTSDCSDTGNVLCRLVDITMNDQAYMLGYTYQASGQNLPIDFGNQAGNAQMYAFQSISALGDPEKGMKSPTIGFSLQPYIAYDQYGPAPLFTLSASTYMPNLDASNGQSVPTEIRTAFSNNSNAPSGGSGTPGSGANYTLPDNATVTVTTRSAEWTIGPLKGTPLYVLRRQVDLIDVFKYPTPAFSPRNYYLDSRSYAADKLYYLRQVDLTADSSDFDYTTGQSWGAFSNVPLDALVIHPNGYAIGVNYEFHKLMIVQLPAAATADADAAIALPLSGKGIQQGLLNGPVAITVAPDGRILILEQDNCRVQAFDTMGNAVQCFAGPIEFDLNTSFTSELNSGSLGNDFQQAYQQNIQPSLSLLFSLPSTCANNLDAGNLTADIKQQFANEALTLSDTGPFEILKTQAGSMWLLIDEGSGLTFDLRKNLYVNLNQTELFSLPATLVSDLNAGTVSAALIQEFADYGVQLSAAADLSLTVVTANSEWLLEDSGANVNYDITVNSGAYAYQGSTLLFNLPAGIVNELSEGAPPADLVELFAGADVTLSADATVKVVTAGSAWSINDPVSQTDYEITTENDIDVFHAAAFNVEVKAAGSEWLLRDTTNTYTFDIKADSANSTLTARQIISTLALKDPASANITYLDIATESKGFIYVLSYSGTGNALSDYHLDIYNPDGSWLCRTPKDAGSSGVNGGRMVVDQWRNLYTLNYESFLGPGDRTEPSVSTWIPSTPDGDDDES